MYFGRATSAGSTIKFDKNNNCLTFVWGLKPPYENKYESLHTTRWPLLANGCCDGWRFFSNTINSKGLNLYKDIFHCMPPVRNFFVKRCVFIWLTHTVSCESNVCNVKTNNIIVIKSSETLYHIKTHSYSRWTNRIVRKQKSILVYNNSKRKICSGCHTQVTKFQK